MGMTPTHWRELAPLRFLESESTYSLYADSSGEQFYIQHGTGRVLRDLDWFSMLELRDSFRESALGAGAWLELLAQGLIDPDMAYEIMFCTRCTDPVMECDSSSTRDGPVCGECLDDYYAACPHCEEWAPDDDFVGIYGGSNVCRRCCENYYTWCEGCDEYFPDSDDHRHYGDGCCESPATVFRIPSGDGFLANDEPVAVTIAGGVISDKGLDEIAECVRNKSGWATRTGLEPPEELEHRRNTWRSADLVHTLDSTWQKRDGNFTKRLARAAYKTYGVKLAPELISEVGNIAAAHSKPVDFHLEITRQLNLPPEDFYHEDSCWWTSYSSSRCALKTNGGFGLRSFDDDGNVSGRAWVLPLKFALEFADCLTPTFDAENADAYMVFNGYGELSGYTPARALAQVMGRTYGKVQFSCSPMYINAMAGYLVAAADLVDRFTDSQIDMDLSTHANLYESESRELVNA